MVAPLPTRPGTDLPPRNSIQSNETTMVASLRVGVLAAACGLAWAASKPLDFSLPDAGGKAHEADELRHYKATVLLFVATECPNANIYAPVLARLYREYSA